MLELQPERKISPNRQQRSTVNLSSKLAVLPLLAVLVFFLLGLSGGGSSGDGGSNLPIPAQNYSARLTDNQGVATDAKRLTWEGKIFLKGQMGKGTITIPFDKISTVKVLPLAETAPNSIQANITLDSGKSVVLEVERATKLYAETDFGNYEIFLKDLQTMEFSR